MTTEDQKKRVSAYVPVKDVGFYLERPVREDTDQHSLIYRVMWNGRPIEVYTISRIAHVLGKTVQALIHWEKHGLLPVTPIRSPSGVRHYTLEMVESVVEASLYRGHKLSLKDTTFRTQVEQAWDALGFSSVTSH